MQSHKEERCSGNQEANKRQKSSRLWEAKRKESDLGQILIELSKKQKEDSEFITGRKRQARSENLTSEEDNNQNGKRKDMR